MDDGGLNPKRMARSKRASSQRSRAKHSKHHAGAGSSATDSRQKFVQEALPSNWERYEEGSGSDDPDSKPQIEGEVRRRSKGADYAELLSSETPKLYEDPPKLEGMVALLLANGLGLTEWDSSYLEPASPSEWKAAQEASALLHLDSGLLGMSLSRLHVSERLFLEQDLFSTQEHVEYDGAELSFTGELAADATSLEERTEYDTDDFTVASTPNRESTPADIPTFGTTVANDTIVSTKSLPRHGKPAQRELPDTGRASDLSSRDLKTGASLRSGAVAHESSGNGASKAVSTRDAGKGSPAMVSEAKTCEATAAETELDELLDMLDSHIAGVPLKADNKIEPLRTPPPGFHSASLGPSESLFYRPAVDLGQSGPSAKELAVDTRPLESARKVPIVGGHGGLPPTSSSSTSSRTVDQSQKQVSPSLDEDFDEWLDSL